MNSYVGPPNNPTQSKRVAPKLGSVITVVEIAAHHYRSIYF